MFQNQLAFTALPSALRPRTAHQPQICMTAVFRTNESTSPNTGPKPAEPSKDITPRLDSIVQRPELVGGLPLWLAMGAMEQLQRVSNAMASAHVAHSRRKVTESVERLRDAAAVEEGDVPMGAMLREIAGAVEVEMSSLKAQLAAKDTELCDATWERERLEKMLQAEKAKVVSMREGVELTELRALVAQMQTVVDSEQKKTAAAEKKLQTAQALLRVLQKEKAAGEQDTVKMSVLSLGLLVVISSFLVQSPVGGNLVRMMFTLNGV